MTEICGKLDKSNTDSLQIYLFKMYIYIYIYIYIYTHFIKPFYFFFIF